MDEPKYDSDRFTLFPWHLFEETVDILKRKGVRFVRYGDLDLTVFFAYRRLYYIGEYAAFLCGKSNPWTVCIALAGQIFRRLAFHGLATQISTLMRRPGHSCVFMQHDADRQPFKTVEMMRLERRLGIVSNNFFFRQRHFCDHDEEPYVLDLEVLKEMERHGFEIGYHQNACQLADYNIEKAQTIAANDIAWLSDHFKLKSFVPHGGPNGPGGLRNSMLPLKGKLRELICAYNGYRGNLLMDFNWSDGGLAKALPMDPRQFARNLPQHGTRARMLMHPQYYGHRLGFKGWEEVPLAGVAWWRKLWRLD